ncbi:MAG: hypothetical protein ACRDIB_10040, partial [Ardenticatenaceae bacterium]
MLLAVLLAVTAIGPRQVLAEVQRFLGYVPGVGFVDLERSRVLAAPVEQTREGVTLRVTQVLAKPDGTDVVLRSVGVLPEPPGRQGQETIEGFQAQLRLPDGALLAAREFELRYDAGSLHFPPLPEDVYRVTLELPHLPLVPGGHAPEAWMLPLTLLPASGELVEELYVQPYQPVDARDTHDGVTLQVLEAAHGAEETLLKVRAGWEDPEWETYFIRGGERSPQLLDDLGHIYENVPPSTSGSVVQAEVEPGEGSLAESHSEVNSVEQFLAFPPVSPAARQFTLVVQGMDFQVPADGSFTVDLGESPKLGDSWPLDIELEVAGFPVRVTSMQ